MRRGMTMRRGPLPIVLFAAALHVAAPSLSASEVKEGATVATKGSGPTVRWFQETEQTLMDAIASGDKVAWARVMDDACVLTTEEGQVLPKQQFLDELRPLPPGLKGGITVRELTVDERPTFAVVRFLADEWETVFGQRLTTSYRVTDTFSRAGAAWRMIASHVAVVTRDPPA